MSTPPAPPARRAPQAIGPSASRTPSLATAEPESAPPQTSAANPSAAPAAATARLFLTAVPVPASIRIDGVAVGPMIPLRELPAGRHSLRFEGADSLGPWIAELEVELRPGETKRLPRFPLQVRRP